MAAQVTILALGDTGEALAIRSLLESMGHEVKLRKVGAPSQVSGALRSAAAEDDVIILSAHGGEKGLFMGAMADPVENALLSDGWLPVSVAFEGVRFGDDTVLISTACAVRESGLAAAMFAAGGHLVAPNGDPDGHIIVPWIGACLLRADAGLAEAVKGANALVGAANRFSYG